VEDEGYKEGVELDEMPIPTSCLAIDIPRSFTSSMFLPVA